MLERDVTMPDVDHRISLGCGAMTEKPDIATRD